ncbi:extensin family protein [Amylibacter sp. SFDW26]|uniref:extensin-like domain-containing protein n=1 Tax=Amylibacter sp. SFDW26 TaxID=2652722 RepID=UPI001261988B|nr:extensin family protein [Amylibacter sp. SFDW26]KAB7610469.1 extensin family protein [Amylibacter sp. SFDW26]
MIKKATGLAVLLVFATTAYASFAPDTSPIPRLRGSAPDTTAVVFNGLNRSPIPPLRGALQNSKFEKTREEIAALVQIAEHERQERLFKELANKSKSTGQTVAIGLDHLKASPVPRLRPSYLAKARSTQQVARIEPVKPRKKRKEKTRVSRKGSVCGVPSIKGTNGARIFGKGGCGVANPVSVTEVSGVALTRPLVVNCTTAKRFNSWVSRSAKPVVGRQGGGLQTIQIIGGYSCRTRNSKRGAKLSEHAYGNAVDIAGFKLRDGTIYSVKKNWRGRGSTTLRRLHKTACGPFGTVLGPNANRAHADHFHFDIAKHRGGAYCR